MEQQAIFAAGSFWRVEAAFRRIPGVTATEVGYIGGHTPNPSYDEVCSDRTGHAEAVRLRFDPGRVSYAELLEVFWRIHDPTTVNRQGPDIGSQFRSAVFYLDKAQEQEARESMARLQNSRRYGRRIATEIVPAGTFYRAEDYHQQYLERHPRVQRI